VLSSYTLQFATDYPVLLVDSDAQILLQDVSDVFRVIEQRGFEAPKGQ
jgi:hypothetical protein